MIRILFIHNQLVCGGAEQALFDLISLMDKAKFDITVLVQYDGGIWEEKFRNAGFRVVSVWGCQKESRNPLIKLQNLNKRKRIAKALKRNGEGLLDVCLPEDFDIVVSYNGSTLQEMCFSGKAKTVKYIHGDMGTNIQFRNNTMAILDTVRKFDRIVCVSGAATDSFKKITGIKDRVIFQYNPLNSDNVRMMAADTAVRLNDQHYICAVGRLSKEKGFDRLIRIHKRLIDEGLYHKLIIVGDGPEKENLEKLIAAVHVNDTVMLIGYQLNPYPYMKNCKFMVCSSYTEGLPVIAMEALSLGIPIVASVPSVEEVFGNEQCGIITGNDDVSLEKGIRKMLADKVYYQQVKASAVRRSAFFDGKCMVQKIEEEFLSLIH